MPCQLHFIGDVRPLEVDESPSEVENALGSGGRLGSREDCRPAPSRRAAGLRQPRERDLLFPRVSPEALRPPGLWRRGRGSARPRAP